MTITINTVVAFDPIKEYEEINKFEKENPQFLRKDTTVKIFFEKTDVYTNMKEAQ